MNGLLLPSLLPASWKLQGTLDQGQQRTFFECFEKGGQSERHGAGVGGEGEGKPALCKVEVESRGHPHTT